MAIRNGYQVAIYQFGGEASLATPPSKTSV